MSEKTGSGGLDHPAGGAPPPQPVYQQSAYPQQPGAAGYPPPLPGYAGPSQGYASPPQPAYTAPPQNVIYQGQPVIQTSYPVVLQAPPPSGPFMSSSLACSFIGLGSVQIGLGIAVMIINIIGNIFHNEYYAIASGYWCGAMFILAGAFGVVSGKKKRKAFVVTFLVLSIINALLFNIGLYGQAGASLGAGGCHYIWDYNSDSDYYYGGHWDCSLKPLYNTLDALMILAGVTELISAIVSSAYCCNALCCRNQPQQYGQVQYLANGGQAVVQGHVQQVQYQNPPQVQQVQYQTVQPPMYTQQTQQPGVITGPPPGAPPAYT